MEANTDPFIAQLTGLVSFLRASARSICANPHDAEDLVHDTYLRAFLAKAQFDGENLHGWTLTIMRNLYRSKLRRMRFGAGSLDDPTMRVKMPITRPTQEVHVELVETLEGMQRLPRGMRAALELIGIDGRTYLQAAAELGVAEGTIKSRLSRGRKQLAELVRAEAA